MTTLQQTILLIEDDSVDAAIVARMLQEPPASGEYRLLHVSTAEAGLSRLDEGDIDCVLLDFRLPDMDGIDVLRQIQKCRSVVPVVAVTGMGSESLAVSAMKEGAKDYIQKGSFTPVSLYLAISNAIERFRTESEQVSVSQQLAEWMIQAAQYLPLHLRDNIKKQSWFTQLNTASGNRLQAALNADQEMLADTQKMREQLQTDDL